MVILLELIDNTKNKKTLFDLSLVFLPIIDLLNVLFTSSLNFEFN